MKQLLYTCVLLAFVSNVCTEEDVPGKPFIMTWIPGRVEPLISVRNYGVQQKGSIVTLQCTMGRKAGDESSDSWEWFKNGVAFKPRESAISGMPFAPWQYIVDAGTYTCKVIKNGIASTMSDPTTLYHRPEKPKIIEVLGDVIARKFAYNLTTESNLELICATGFNGVGPVTVFWWYTRFGRRMYFARGSRPTIVIQGSIGDTAPYKCRAVKGNLFSAISDILIATIKDPPPGKPVIMKVHRDGYERSSANVTLGSLFELRCTTESNGVGPLFWEWYKDGRVIAFTGSSATLSIKTTKLDDAGSYQCKASQNHLLSDFSDNLKITVNV